MSEADRIANNILEFAERHKLLIHPGRDIKEWAELVIKEGSCPCVSSRKSCPCEQVLQDIEEEDCCRCRLFINDAYLELYNQLMARRKK
jgi:ferredoxin-thioredoxin reductase catalytic subunit